MTSDAIVEYFASLCESDNTDIEESTQVKGLDVIYDLFRNVINEKVITNKDFKISFPMDKDMLIRIFGHTLSTSQIQKLGNHTTYIILFSNEIMHDDKKGVYRIKDNPVKRRREIASSIENTIEEISDLVRRRPIMDVFQAIDKKIGLFGTGSIYVCCIWALDNDGYGGSIFG